MRTNIFVPLALCVVTTVGWGFGRLPTTAAESESPDRRDPAPEVQRDGENRGPRRPGDGMRLRPGRPAAELQEVQRGLDRAMAELQQLRAAGNEEAALEKKKQVQELQAQLERLQRRQRMAGRDREPMGDQMGGREFGRRPPLDRPELERKLQHLQIAIENLHAAGMHDPAERLAQQAEMMRRNLQGPPAGPGPRPPAEAGPELLRLRSEVQDLRRAVGELKERIEELARDARAR